MKKKILSCLCSLLIVFGLIFISVTDANASTELSIVEGSYLTYNTESIGYAVNLTRGVDLLNGYAKIVRLGPGLIYAGGTTMAAHTVDTVGIAVMVERTTKDSDSWEFIAGWTKQNKNSDRASDNRELNVKGDYYYRVRCIHSANNDVSDSFTDGIYIEKP